MRDKIVLHVDTQIETWAMATPLKISGHVFGEFKSLVVTVSDGVRVGRGEAAGVYYRNETPKTMLAEIALVADEIAKGISRRALLDVMSPGGARNAVDCALWELESLQQEIPVWQLAGLNPPQPLITTMTVGAAEPHAMALEAVEKYPQARALKLKLLGDGIDGRRVSAVRAARSDVWLGVDANQGFTPETLRDALPAFLSAQVALMEQPFVIGKEALLDADFPIPIAADESVQSIDDLPNLVGRVQAINIKLDKCGGLTAALDMMTRARELGFQVMIGTMTGTSLSVAPAFLAGQLCDIVDLDAPLFLSHDRKNAAMYDDGKIVVPPGLWGWPIQ